MCGWWGETPMLAETCECTEVGGQINTGPKPNSDNQMELL